MRAREWAVARQFRTPADYDIPRLPAWRVRRDDCGRLVFADDETDAFIAAEKPICVRR